MKKSSPNKLIKKTKLRPDQLERVKGGSGGGEASKYREDGTQSLALTKKLFLAKKKAKRFVLATDELGRRLYVADLRKVKGSKESDKPLTFNRSEALEFFEGFDDPDAKSTYYRDNLAFTLNGVTGLVNLTFYTKF